MFLNVQGEICLRRYGADSVLSDEGGCESLSRRACRNTENSLVSGSRAQCRKTREREEGWGGSSTKHANMSAQGVHLLSLESTFLHGVKAQT